MFVPLTTIRPIEECILRIECIQAGVRRHLHPGAHCEVIGRIAKYRGEGWDGEDKGEKHDDARFKHKESFTFRGKG